MNGAHLSQEEFARRVKAALAVRGTSERALRPKLKAHGLKAHDLGQAIRPKGKKGQSDALIDALVKLLRMPRWWFTAENLEEVMNRLDPSPAELDGVLAEIERVADRVSGQAPGGAAQAAASKKNL